MTDSRKMRLPIAKVYGNASKQGVHAMSPRSSIALMFLIGLLIAANGCANLTPSAALPFINQGTAEAEPAPTATCWVEMRPVSGKAKKIQLPITQDMRVDQVLDDSRVSFRQMDVFILRQSPEDPNQHVKLEIRFDRDTGQVKWDTDYAIHPDDRIIVKEETLTVFDEAYNALLGPVMGRIGRR